MLTFNGFKRIMFGLEIQVIFCFIPFSLIYQTAILWSHVDFSVDNSNQLKRILMINETCK